ncbi:hypothetical protein LOK49_LG02G00873 [Camellia lanceoleosa]|uniref:Uncharacterized protein n=1 Tax=Camellia lanceoleosa TaxID=1840588 RepID=A0ACC0IMS6_9ERIC|nr:hypothetical protein LOK49_LG02G00873 [Camellia lanceoleosa]
MLCCWVEDPNGDYYKKHLARIPDYIWVAEDGIKMQSFGSQQWDTSLSVQAILACNMLEETGEVLRKGHDFIKKSQVKDNPSGDFKKMFRHISKGSWTFSDQDHGWQVSDCTAEGFKCCLLLSQLPPEIVGEKHEAERLYDAVNVILSLQSKTGGLAAWEPVKAGKYSRVRKWTLGLSGGKDQIVIIRASGSISRVRGPFSVSGSGITSEQFIEKIRSVREPLSVIDSSVSLNDGRKVRISYKGVPGAYSEDAALKAYSQCETVPYNKFEDAFKAVELWLANKTVLPIENSLGGSIHRNYDLLLRHKLHIVGEVQLAVNLCLLALPGVRTEHLKRVLSHPQALAQSDIILSKLGATRENVNGTASAAQLVASNELRDAGAVASAQAAEIYGLDILTSIVFTLEEGPGVLFKALATFALRDINLTKIESWPQRKHPLREVDNPNNGSAK